MDEKASANIVIPLVILIIFIIFLGWMLYLLVSSGFSSTSIENPVSSDNRTATTIICAPGQCETNLLTGQKTCPTQNESLEINPAQSVCNSAFVCDNPLTPFAVQSDGSTNINGVCEPNVECPCLRISQCANYVLSVFTASNGNPYQPTLGQRLSFPQSTSYVNAGGTTSDIPPIQFQNPATTFCAAPAEWLPLSNPGCNFVNNVEGITYSDILTCMGTINGCSGLTASPCLQGVLAAISPDPASLTQETVMAGQFACVRGTSCPCGYLNVYDTNYGNTTCIQI